MFVCHFFVTILVTIVYCCMQAYVSQTAGFEVTSKGSSSVIRTQRFTGYPKLGGKVNPAARQLVLFTFTYGDTRKKQAHTTAGNHQDEKLRLWAFPPLLNPPCAQWLSWHSLLFAHVNVSFSIYSSHFLKDKGINQTCSRTESLVYLI